MIREDLRNILQSCFPHEDVVIDYVPKGKDGDYYTNLAFKIAAREGKNPWEVANNIASQIKSNIVKRISVHEPAFINFTLSEEYMYEQLSKELKIDIGKGRSILIEYVSANPTGPINIVSARAAAVGDSLIRLLRKTGFEARAEYYVNDAGKQTDLLAESVYQRMSEIRGGKGHIPEHGYHGEYVKELAQDALDKGLEKHADIKKYCIQYFVDQHRKVMENFGVFFDQWSFESNIYRKNYVERVLGILKSKGLTYTQDGALFFKTTDFGDDKDRVIVTSDQRNTYLLPDIAYHLDKIERKYDQLVNIWGPDHHGRIKGLVGGIQALGYPASIIKVLIVQEVKLKRSGKFISMSKRAGTFATLSSLLEKVPSDVVRFFFLMRSSSQHLDFDLDLAAKQSEENPVYYVQYAYARIKSIIRYAEESGIARPERADLTLIREKEELTLVKDILRFAETLEDVVHNFDPYILTYYLIELARNFHYFYQKHRVVGEDEALTKARLYLIEKTATTLRNGLELLGVSCPEKM